MKSNSLGELRHRVETLTGWTFDHADARGRMAFRVGKGTHVWLTVAQAEWLLDQGADRDGLVQMDLTEAFDAVQRTHGLDDAAMLAALQMFMARETEWVRCQEEKRVVRN